MKSPAHSLKRTSIVVLLLTMLLSCSHYISPYDQYAYTQTTSLKVDVLNLIELSTEPYSSHEKEVEQVVSGLKKAIEYEKHRPKNDITLKMWQKMIDSTAQKGIVGSYLSSWKRTGTKSTALIAEFTPLAAKGFDLIAELESKKIQDSNAGCFQFPKQIKSLLCLSISKHCLPN